MVFLLTMSKICFTVQYSMYRGRPKSRACRGVAALQRSRVLCPQIFYFGSGRYGLIASSRRGLRLKLAKNMGGAFLHADFITLGTIRHACFMVNMYQSVFQGDRFGGTHLNAHAARNATDAAHFFDGFSRVPGPAGDPYPGLGRYQLNDVFRTRTHAGAARHALGRVHNRKTVDYGDGIKLTGPGAVAQPYARKPAGHGAAKRQTCGGAGDVTHVFLFFQVLAFGSGTAHGGDPILDGRKFFAGQDRNLLRHLGFSGKAECRGDIRVIDHCFGICFASREAAAASLGPGQDLQDLFDLRIGLHREFVGAGMGFLVALFLMSSVRERLELANVPATYRGLPIAFVVAGLFALAFMGFSGMSIF